MSTRRPLWRVALAGALAIPALFVAPALRAEYDEYAVKAAFLVNFARLVTWPAESAPPPDGTLVVGLVGPAAEHGALRPALESAELPGRRLAVRTVRDADEIAGCHILFVTGKAPRTWIASASGSGALLVGESAEFAERGGMINFFVADRKVRFEINRPAAERAGFEISSRLLRLAVLVGSGT